MAKEAEDEKKQYSFDDLVLMVAEGVESMSSNTAIKVLKAMHPGMKIKWRARKDGYEITFPGEK